MKSLASRILLPIAVVASLAFAFSSCSDGDAPVISLRYPVEDSVRYDSGDTIRFLGVVTDDSKLSDVHVSIRDEDYPDSLIFSVHYSPDLLHFGIDTEYVVVTSSVTEYILMVSAEDESGNTGRAGDKVALINY